MTNGNTNPASGALAPEEVAPATPLLSRLNARGFRLVMLADAVMLASILVGSMLIRFGGWNWPSYPLSLYFGSFAVALVIVMAGLYFGGLYEREPRLGAPPILPRAARQMLGSVGLIALLSLMTTGVAQRLDPTTERALPFPTLNLVIMLVVGAIGVELNRQLAAWLRTRREGPPQVLVAGPVEDVAMARGALTAERASLRVVGEATGLDGLAERVRSSGATDVIVLTSLWLDDLYPTVMDELEQHGVTVLLRVSGRETMLGLDRIREVGGLPFVLLRAQSFPRSRARFKRLLDIVVLAFASPVMLIVTGLVALYQLVVAGRPLLYWQDRVGAQGRVFRLVKFRTMAPDAESDGLGARLADRDDPRVVRGCLWIRAMRLDELPQLWNVLRGDMSLVGPRPERPELTERFERLIPGYERRYEVPPGLTGLAQIHGRYHTDAAYKLGYDLQYLVNWSPVLDVEILLRTVWVVLTRRL